MKNFSLFLLILITSCGGGGGTSQASSIPSSTGSVPTSGGSSSTGLSYDELKQEYEDAPEYQNQYGLALINASSAYARGATGEGVLIGIMDSGVDTNHQELDGQSKFTSDSYLAYSSRSPTIEEKRHGTHVSGIAVGERDGTGIHGVAFDAQLFFISIELSEPPPNYEPVPINSSIDYSEIDDSWSTLESYFLQRGVTVVNGSFGYQGNINDYNESDLRYAFPKTISALAQANTSDAEKTIFVWSAGNAGAYADEGVDYSSPEVFPGMAYLLPELQGHTIAVVSVDNTGSISWFSSRCGVAKDYCIAAPGEDINSAYSSSGTSQYAEFSGTSMAAPHVSGGLALLADYFRGQLGNTELVQRLFATANKEGIYSNSEIYGQGLMDLDAATSPVGSTMVAVSPLLSELKYSETRSKINFLPNFVGDAFNNLFEKEYVVFDELGAPFFKKVGTSFQSLPISYLTYLQTNSMNQIREIKSNLNGLSYSFGINDFSKDYQPDSVSLWAKDRKRLKYFSLKSDLSENNFIFMGNGISPKNYFGSNSSYDNLDRYFYKDNKINPYLDFTSNGSFIGFGRDISNNFLLTGAILSGKHEDSERYISPSNSSGFLLELKQKNRKFEYAFQLGFISESNSIMGSYLTGGYGLSDSSTYYSGINFSTSILGFKSINSFLYGKSNPNINKTGILKDFEELTSSSFSMGLFKETIDKGIIGMQISQPLRLEKGTASFQLPVGRTRDKNVLFENFIYDFSPSGRQIDLELLFGKSYKNLSFNSRLGFSRNYEQVEGENKFFFQGNIILSLD